MGKKKNGKKSKWNGAIPVNVMVGLAEALLYDEIINECLKDLRDDNPEELDSTEYLIAEREKVFSMMSDREVEAYDLIDNFVNSGKAGLPDDDRSLEARIEHADWNNEDFRGELVHVIACFESAIAYYATVKTIMPERKFDIADELEEIQACLYDICDYGKELELLIRREYAEFRMNEASIELNESFEDRETLDAQLEAFYIARAEECSSFFDDEGDEDDEIGEDVEGDESTDAEESEKKD